MSSKETTAYNSGQDLMNESNPYTPFTEAYWMFEKGRLDSAGIDALD
jgi:hypothetical protein